MQVAAEQPVLGMACPLWLTPHASLPPSAAACLPAWVQEYPNVLTLRVRMPIVGDLVYPRNFITKIIKWVLPAAWPGWPGCRACGARGACRLRRMAGRRGPHVWLHCWSQVAAVVVGLSFPYEYSSIRRFSSDACPPLLLLSPPCQPSPAWCPPSPRPSGTTRSSTSPTP
jgi:hypothetical protein